ncbi:hypothetical protein Dimus_016149, partial [Dionaea muscipula]
MNSEEERCPSSKGESAASEASNFDAATELDEEGTDLAPISDFPHGPDILGLPDPCIPFDLAAIAAQVNKKSSIVVPDNISRKPKSSKKIYSRQRVPVAKQKNHIPQGLQTCPDPNPSSDLSSLQKYKENAYLLVHDPCLITDPGPQASSSTDAQMNACNLPKKDQINLQPEDPQQTQPDGEGFYPVQH